MKKIMNLLLALALCVALAAPALAESTEEPPAPGEAGEVTDLEKSRMFENEPTTSYFYHCDFSDLDWEEVENEPEVLKRAYVMLALPEDSGAAEMRYLGSWECGHDHWGPAAEQDPFEWEEDGETDTLIAHYLVGYACKTAGCYGLRYDLRWRSESRPGY